jgi:hypothetical protein
MHRESMGRASAASGRAVVALALVLASAFCGAVASCAADAVPAARAAAPDTVATQQTAPMERVVGTVRSFDSRAHTLVVMTGVGYAVRVVRITLPPNVTIRGSAPDPPALEPGCIVRIECTRAGAARAASTPRVAGSVIVLIPAPRPRTP